MCRLLRRVDGGCRGGARAGPSSRRAVVIRCSTGGGVRAACSRRRIATQRRIAAIAGAVYKRCGCAFWPREQLIQRLRYRKLRTKAIEWRLIVS